MNNFNQNVEAPKELAVQPEAGLQKFTAQQENPEEIEIDLLELAYLLLDQLHYIVLFFLLGALLVNAYSYFLIHPTYQSTASLYVVSASGGSVVDLTDLNIGSSLKSDYQELIMSYPVLDRVSEKLDLGLNTQAMRSMISISNPADTRILQLTATAESPELARDVANTLAEVAVEYLPDTMSTDAPNIAQRARLESQKTGPSYAKFTVIGGMLGAMAFCAWVVVSHLMDDTIHSEEDARGFFGAPPLAAVPYVVEMDTERPESGVAAAENVSGSDDRILVRLPELPYSAEEALNRLRVNVKFSGKHTRKILVTSSVPNEGKSHISVYLWRMLAEAGHRTVLVDADLRKSVLKGAMELPKGKETPGLSYYLSGLAEYEDVVHQTTIENADIVPCVNLLQNPSSLLEDPRLKELLERLAEDYDYVIVDTPPLVSVSDGAIIAALCDGAVLVVRSGETPRALIRQSLAQLSRTNCRLMGTVLNGVDTGKRVYGRYYGGNYYNSYYTEYYADSGTGEQKKVKKKTRHHKES